MTWFGGASGFDWLVLAVITLGCWTAVVAGVLALVRARRARADRVARDATRSCYLPRHYTDRFARQYRHAAH